MEGVASSIQTRQGEVENQGKGPAGYALLFGAIGFTTIVTWNRVRRLPGLYGACRGCQVCGGGGPACGRGAGVGECVWGAGCGARCLCWVLRGCEGGCVSFE
jgi:hypothetical protein